jgi:hypothetical protein
MIDTIHRFVAIAGRAIDDSAGKPVAGAQARIVSGPPGFQPSVGHLDTRPDGLFYFMDLPNGDYVIELKAAGAPPVNTRVAVARASGAVMPPANADAKLELHATQATVVTKPAKSKTERRPNEQKR